MRPHVLHCSDASGWDHMSHESASPTVLLLCTSLSAQSNSVCHDVSLITFVLCGMRPSCNDFCTSCFKMHFFIHNICPCFLRLFRLFCIIVLMFHNFLQPNWHIHWKWILTFMMGVLVQLVTNIATVLHCCQSNCAYVQATLNWKQWALHVHNVALCWALFSIVLSMHISGCSFLTFWRFSLDPADQPNGPQYEAVAVLALPTVCVCVCRPDCGTWLTFWMVQ